MTVVVKKNRVFPESEGYSVQYRSLGICRCSDWELGVVGRKRGGMVYSDFVLCVLKDIHKKIFIWWVCSLDFKSIKTGFLALYVCL